MTLPRRSQMGEQEGASRLENEWPQRSEENQEPKEIQNRRTLFLREMLDNEILNTLAGLSSPLL